jgi:hypothetical protein
MTTRVLSTMLRLSLGVALWTPRPVAARVGEPESASPDPSAAEGTGDPQEAEDAADAEETAEPDADQQRLKELFDRARTLYGEGRYEEAISAFESAYDVSPEPNLLYNVFVCYERLDQPQRALEALERYAAIAPAEEQEQIAKDRRRLQATIERREAETAEPVGDAAQPPVTEETSTPAEPIDRGGPRERIYGPAAWALTAVTGVALGVGIGFGISSSNLTNDAQDECIPGPSGPICPRSAQSTIDKAHNRGIVADVSFGVAGVAAIALVAVIAVKVARRNRNTKAASWSPYGGPHGAGLQVQTRF